MIKRNGDNVFAIASSNNQCQGGRSAVSLCPGGGAATRIPRATAARMTPPDAQQHTKEANIAISTYVEKWKNRYEDAERKHKTYLLKSEKAKREYDDLQRRYNILFEERQLLDSELRERTRELNKLKTVSEKLFNEYQQLKNQRDVDAGVMHKVMQQAGEWYKQNKQLKRRSTALIQALPAKAVEIDLTDSLDTASDASSNEEVEFLKQTVSELSRQVAALQTELAAARLQEFEAQEANVATAQELEAEKEKSSAQEKELQELRTQLERHNRVSKLLMEEVTGLKNNADKDREMAETALLLGELDPDQRLLRLMDELPAPAAPHGRAGLPQGRAGGPGQQASRPDTGTAGGAIDAIVDQIKGGKFQLKSTEHKVSEKKVQEEQPEAVKEMLAILGTLRKRRTSTRPGFSDL
ncbi:hypothetical protein B5X24_HaOG202478 [Helicoverpa armigera]|uniref:Uncharacterized protein n=1 Tax=Helicoverpa armigera TaxID=29058 RepID=A0A2W1BYB6_HELAM|nr:hypothetical protein B5X24_HaOG202478 [Helicoverpa armigera]